MHSTRLLYEPQYSPHGPSPSAFTQPPPLSFEDPFLATASNSTSNSHLLPFDLHLPIFPPPPPPSSFESMNFFSTNEQDDMLDFLRDFDAADPWEFNPILPSTLPPYPSQPDSAQSTNNISPLAVGGLPEHDLLADSSSAHSQSTPQAHRPSPPATTTLTIPQPSTRHHHHIHTHNPPPSSSSSVSPTDYRPKPLLSGPQKRMNHVKSEKRRRDTIRDGYLTLTKLLSPSGPGAEQLAIPRRGRPKGSGRAGNGKKTGKGKSGVLFRAVEYIRFMEEGCEGLEIECERLERLVLAAGNTAGNPASGSVTFSGTHSW